MKKPLRIFLIFFTFSILALDVFGQDPFIPRYNAVKRSERCFTVTYDANNQFGAVWWSQKVDFSQDTTFNFVVYMGDKDDDGADGLAFVMHQDPRDTLMDPNVTLNTGAQTFIQEAATGDAGGGLGYAEHNSNPLMHQRISPSVAVEFDTWNNHDVQDGNKGTDGNGVDQPRSPYYSWDHTAVVYNGDLYKEQQIIEDAEGNTGRILPLKPSYAFGPDAGLPSTNPDGSPYHNIEDNRCYTFQIRWIVNNDGTQTLQLWADVYDGTTNTSNLKMVMTHTDSMLTKVFNGNPLMRFGFTGSTGGSINEQTICLLGENLKPYAVDDYAQIPLNTGAIVDITANDADPDGDQLSVPNIVVPAKHGLASIFNDQGTDKMRYIPNENYVGKDTVGYVTCDVNSTKCYAKCDTAFVYLDITCIPWDIDAFQIKPNQTCLDTFPPNGAAQAEAPNAPFPGPFWFENFDDLQDGTTADNGETAWSFTTSGNCKSGNVIEVQNAHFRAKKTGCEVNWTSEVMDISSYTDVSVTFDLWSSGKVDQNDYVEAYYKVDGGPEIPFDNGVFHGEFNTPVQASTSNINGNTLQIIIKMKTEDQGGGEENYFIDNILASGVGATPLINYYWYEGTSVGDSTVAEGDVATGLKQGTYTVIAQEPITGCYSNPVTVLIDSIGNHVNGGFIDQVAPFTNCKLPYDGALKAAIYDGTDTVTTGYTFEWYYRESPKVGTPIRVGPLAENLEGREYSVVITDNTTGCDTLVSGEVPIQVVIPAVNASTLSDVYSCLDANSGVAQANVGDSTSGYVFDWWAGPAVTTAPPDYSGDTLRVLPVGTYAVHATDTTTGCVSDPVNVSINSNLVYPDPLVNVVSQQTSCDPSNPTGELSAEVDLGGGSTTTAGFTFNWYKGLNNVVPARPGYSGGPDVDGLDIGQYRLIVVNDTSGCQATTDTLIQDKTVTPTLANVTSTPVTVCTVTPNGTITVTVNGNTADFNYQLYKGNTTVPDSLLSDQSANIFTDLAVGDYTVTATDKVSKCVTSPEYISVGETKVFPDADITATSQTSCDTGNPNGTLDAAVTAGMAGDYSYQWYVTDTTGAAVTTTSGSFGAQATSLAAGQYAVLITNNTTECANVFYGDVINSVVYPKLDTAYTAPSKNCTPLEDGELFTTVDGGSTDASLYAFQWEDLTNSVILSDTTAHVQNVAPGDYRLTITNKSTACPINPRVVTVDDQSITPVPVIDVTDNTSCDPANPNGEMEVTSVGPGSPTLTDYKYEWFDPADVQLVTPGVAFSPDSTTVSKVGDYSSGTVTYKLKITEKATACYNEVFADVKTLSVIPSIDNVTVTDAVNCTEDFGSAAEVTSVNSLGSVPAGYTFDWIDADNSTTVASDAGKKIEDTTPGGIALPPGNYQVIAKNTYCQSDPYDFEIKDVAIRPSFTLTGVDNTSCSTTLPNGIIVATRTNSGVDVDIYDWFKGNISGSTFASTAQNDSIQYGLDGGDYAVQATSTNRCTSAEYVTLVDGPTNLPLLDTLATSDLTKCNTFDGKIAYQVTSPSPVDLLPPFNTQNRTYTFYAINDVSFSDTTLIDPTHKHKTDPSSSRPDSVNFTDLENGYWSAVVVDDYTHCQSPSITNYLNLPPAAEIDVSVNLPGDCTSDNGGEINITSSAPDGSNDKSTGIGPGYDYNWFDGTDMTTVLGPPATITATDIPDKWSSTASTLTSGYYTVQAVDRITACAVDTSIFLPATSLPTFEPIVTVDSKICATPGDGQSTIEVDNTTFGTIPPAPGTPAGNKDYDYIVFKGRYFDVNWAGPGNGEYTVALGNTGTVPANGPFVLTNFDTGTYTIVAKERFGNNCFSSPATFDIGLDFDLDLSTNLIDPDNTCQGAPNGTGRLDASNVNSGVGTTVEYTWYEGTDTNDPGKIVFGPSPTGQTNQDLWASTYTVKAEVTAGDGLGCIYTKPDNVPKVKDTLKIIDAPVTNVDKCTYGNGTAYINDISENGVSVGTANYDNFIIYDKDHNKLALYDAGTSSDPWDSLSVNSFYLTATNTITNCVTPPYKIDIGNDAQKPLVAITLDSLDYSCAPNLNNTGKLSATADGTQDINEYTFEWYSGTDTSQVANKLDVPQFYASIDPYTAHKLYGGAVNQAYTVVVTDTSDVNEGCVATKTKSVPHQNTTFSLDLAHTDQTNCTPNGTITVNQVDQSDGINPATTETSAGGYSLFALQLLNSNLSVNSDPSITADPLTGQYSSMPGTITYNIRATNTSTQCVSQPKQVKVVKTAKKPYIKITEIPDLACNGGTNTGELIAEAYGGSDNVKLINGYDWHYSGTNMSPPNITMNHIYQLASGDYTIIVTDNEGKDLGCVDSIKYSLTRKIQNINITNAIATPRTVCYDNGTAQINEITVDGVAINSTNSAYSDYERIIKDAQLQVLNPANYSGTGSPSDPFADLHENTYFLQVRNMITNCYSSTKQVVVKNQSVKPVISTAVITPQYSLNPNSTSTCAWTGVIRAGATEANGGYYGFNYSWYQGGNTSGTLIVNDSTATKLDDGLYTVWAKSDSTQCTQTATLNLPFVYQKPAFDPVASPQTICSPWDGSVELVNMTLDGNSDNLSDYTFSGYKSSYNPGSPTTTFAGNDTRTAWDNLQAGTYYFVAKESCWQVESDPIAAVVKDSIFYPIITYDGTNSKAQTSCDPSVLTNGALSVIVYEDGTGLPGNYNYEWYRNDGSLIQDSTRSMITGLQKGKYKIVAINTATGCQTEKIYPVEEKRTVPVLTASSSPVTFCDPDKYNGITSAFVINSVYDQNQDLYYTFNWSEGVDAKQNPDFTGQAWNGLGNGLYTVVAVDNANPTCISSPVSITVDDETVNPKISVIEVGPLTNCNPAKPNAAFSAMADGTISGYSFDWYVKDGGLYFNGPNPVNLGDTTYRLVVKNISTGCQSETNVRPSVSQAIVPKPDVDIIGDRTSCNDPDGIATASISGNLTDYIFRFYKASNNKLLDNPVVDYKIQDLDVDNYYVTAESRQTGCVSGPTPFSIADERYFPKIDFITTPSNCENPSGTAQVIIGDVTMPYRVYWRGDNGFEAQGEYIQFLPAGKYSVDVEGTDGCFTQGETEVKADIIIYNGVSDNNDGLNDYFQIVCLELFPNNNVKIFNRSGQLVYEQDGYDMHNPDRRFHGIANRGAISLGTELPIGTYFYIVDKNDGSKPKVGYLELNR